MVKKYKCGICGNIVDQKSHHESHLKTKKHKQEVKIKKLEMKEKKGFKLSTKNINSKEIEKKLNEEIEKLETVIINEEESTECQNPNFFEPNNFWGDKKKLKKIIS